MSHLDSVCALSVPHLSIFLTYGSMILTCKVFLLSQVIDDETGLSLDDLELGQQEFVTNLFKQYPILMGYSKDYPVIIDPKGKKKYFAMTIEKATEWAKNGVSASIVVTFLIIVAHHLLCFLDLNQHDDKMDIENTPAHLLFDLDIEKNKGCLCNKSHPWCFNFAD